MEPKKLHDITGHASVVSKETREGEDFLRKPLRPFNPKEFTLKDLRALVRHMRTVMKRHAGIGIATNQVGLDFRFCLIEPPHEGDTKEKIFYAIGNPEIIESSRELDEDEEGCLSVPALFGTVIRRERVTVRGIDIHNRKITIKANGLVARIFQHEIDHLNGKLFIDRAVKTRPSSPQ